MPKEILPKNLIVSFKNNKIVYEIISSFGNSGILNLANPEEGIYDTYFSLFTLKYYYPIKSGEQFPGFDAMTGMKIKKTSKTTVICGYNCKNALVRIPTGQEFEVWYTNEIDIKNPNYATPYSELDGVLMSFFFLIGTAELHFEAETVYKKDIPDAEFERRDKYVRVSREEINKFINKMITL